MKITKRQLKRVIREEKSKLIKEQGEQPVGDPGSTPSFQDALDDLDTDLRNAIHLAIDRGLILDDIMDALSLAEEFAEMQLRV